MLVERFFEPLGVVQAGAFYKALQIRSTAASRPRSSAASTTASRNRNRSTARARTSAASIAWQQHLTLLPGSPRLRRPGELQLHDIAGEGARTVEQARAPAAGAEQLESRRHLRPRRILGPAGRDATTTRASSNTTIRTARTAASRDRWATCTSIRTPSWTPRPLRLAPAGSSRRLAAESEQRSVRVLSGQPAVPDSARVLQPDGLVRPAADAMNRSRSLSAACAHRRCGSRLHGPGLCARPEPSVTVIVYGDTRFTDPRTLRPRIRWRVMRSSLGLPRRSRTRF